MTNAVRDEIINKLLAAIAAIREERDALRLALLEIADATDTFTWSCAGELRSIARKALEKDYGHAPPQA